MAKTAGVDSNFNPSGGNSVSTTPADPGNANAPDPNAQAPIPGFTPAGSDALTNSPYGTIAVTAGSITQPVNIGTSVNPTDHVLIEHKPSGKGQSRTGDQDLYSTVIDQIQSIQQWYGNATQRQQMINEMYSAGLLSSKKSPSTTDVIKAWSLLVQEASIQGNVTPQELLNKAAQGGWNALNPTLKTTDFGGSNTTGNTNNAADASTTTSETVYKSYLDPATIMGAAADAFYRLVGRNPTPAEYKGFLDMVYGYQNEENTGRFESATTTPSNKGQIDPQTGLPVGPTGTNDGSLDPTKATSIVSQRSIGTRGLEFLAGQAALASPDEPNYQAATTYTNALIKALSGPAAGMQASGPTTTVP